jgi:hypothetical protein
MECDKIQEQLSAYIENTLSPAERQRLDEHLKSCPSCAASLSDLEKTLHYLQGLDEITPPAWLTQQVMSRVKTESERAQKSLWKKLFYPLHIKLPLEAAGIVLIAITALFVFKSIEPEIKTVMAPSKETVTEYGVREKDLPPAAEPQKSSQPPAVTRPKKDETNIVVTSPREGKSLPAPASEPFMYDKEQAVKETPEEEFESPKKKISRSAAPPAAERSADIELKQEPARRTPGLAMSRMPEKEDISLSFKAGNIDTAKGDIKKTFSDLGGRLIKEDLSLDTMIIVGELSSDKLSLLMERLKTLGYLKERTPTPLSDKNRILIKITVSAP